MASSKTMVDIQVTKSGPSGRPAATILAPASTSLDKLIPFLQKEVTRNVDLRKKLGLKACATCISGMDLDLRHRFDHVLSVDLGKAGG